MIVTEAPSDLANFPNDGDDVVCSAQIRELAQILSRTGFAFCTIFQPVTGCSRNVAAACAMRRPSAISSTYGRDRLSVAP